MTSHAFVLLSVDRHPRATVRELAEAVGLTERQVHRVLADLEEEGYITRKRIGRQNQYAIDRSRSLRHPAAMERDVGDLLAVMTGEERRRSSSSTS